SALAAFPNSIGNSTWTRRRVDRRPNVAFLMNGLGSETITMGRELYETVPRYRHSVDEVASHADSFLAKPLLSSIYSMPSGSIDTSANQLALFATQYAIFNLPTAWGIRPNCIAGHGIGEYAAACVSGVFSVYDAIRVIAKRTQTIAKTIRPGGMCTVEASQEA